MAPGKEREVRKLTDQRPTGRTEVEATNQTRVAASLPGTEEQGEVDIDSPRPIPRVVGLVASAGGLDAFKKFLGAIPADPGMAFVVIPHLDPNHKSLMAELLSKCTKLPVSEVAEADVVQANHVYVLPANKYLTIHQGQLHLVGPVLRQGIQTSIDVFLRSLAEDRREQAVGVVLSGTGAHGTLGVKAIKEAGGLVMVQEPRTAEFDQMPTFAIATGLADFILPPDKMPAALVEYARHTRTLLGLASEPSDELNTIIALLRARTKHDFRCYRKKMLIRRIERRMGLSRYDHLSQYLMYLRENPDEIQHLVRDLLISVTCFFRDPEAYSVVETQVLPALIQSHDPDAPLRVWVPACATGEEAYSLALICLEQLAAAHKSCRLQVFATDVDERALDVARRGIYPDSIAADLTPERLSRYFTRTDDHSLMVSKQLREVVTFASQNLICDAPFSKLDLISCRNLLIYLEAEYQKKIIALLHFGLNPGGYLFLGPSETIGAQIDLFEPVSKKWRIYRRIGLLRPDRVDFPIVTAGEHPLRRMTEVAGSRPDGMRELAQTLLLERFSPAAVLINRKYEVLYFQGPTFLYLEQPTGEPTTDLMLLAREGLRTKLRAAVHKAVADPMQVATTTAQLSVHGDSRSVVITVHPVQAPKSAEGLLLVTFVDEVKSPAPISTQTDTSVDEPLVRQLEGELASTREDLQSSIEELESSNEQLKASNEEVMSMNEELQSANEELETSKEELQSLNEELGTVNNQLHDKVEELERSTNDLANLLTCTEIATVFLDPQMRILRFTPATKSLLNLIATDIGRPISDLAPKFSDETLLADCQEVVRSLIPREHTIRSRDGLWNLRRVLPYRTIDNRIDGVVITFTDVTQLKQAAERLQRLATVLVDSNDAITVQDLDGRFIAWNRGAERTYGYTEAEALTMRVEQLVPPELWARERENTERLRRGERVESWETRRITKAGRILDVWLTATMQFDEASRPIALATTERDIGERKQAEAEIRKLNADLERRVAERASKLELATRKLEEQIAEREQAERAMRESRDQLATILDTAAEGIVTIDEAGMIRSYNLAAEAIFGYSFAEVNGQNVSRLMPEPEAQAHDGYLAMYLQTNIPKFIGTRREVIGRRKDGSQFPMELSVSELRFDGRRFFTGMVRDLSDRRELERQVLEIAAEQQRRIGQDLHDTVGQELTGLGLMADSLVECFEKTHLMRPDLAGKIASGIHRLLGQVRDLSHGLAPVEVDAAGLMGALRELAGRCREQSGITCTFTCLQPVLVDNNATATHLYLIAREAVTNALKHGAPTRVDIRLESDDRRLMLVIEDDGRGMQVSQNHVGVGLSIMKHRAAWIQAELELKPLTENRGVVVKCLLPKRTEQKPEKSSKS